MKLTYLTWITTVRSRFLVLKCTILLKCVAFYHMFLKLFNSYKIYRTFERFCYLFLDIVSNNLLLGTQRVISFLRQMVEHNGFYRSDDQAWVKLERIQFVGACNPPTDPGRKPLSHRCSTSTLTVNTLLKRHSIGMNSRATHLMFVCRSAHVALRMLLAFSQPVNCIFWPIDP